MHFQPGLDLSDAYSRNSPCNKELLRCGVDVGVGYTWTGHSGLVAVSLGRGIWDGTLERSTPTGNLGLKVSTERGISSGAGRRRKISNDSW